MRISRFLAILLCLGAMVTVSPGETVRWYLSLNYAKSVAKRTGRLVMLELFAYGMSSGSRYVRDTYPDPRVVQSASKFVPVRLDMSREGMAVAQKYGVMQASTILFLRPDGKLVHRVVGYYDPRGLLVEMAKAEGAGRDRETYIARLKQSPMDGEAAARLAAIYAYELDINRAQQALATAEKFRPAKPSYLFPEAYNAVGDYYQIGGDFERAIPYFQKAAVYGRRPYDLAYAYISIGSCYLNMRAIDRAMAEFQKVETIPGVSEDDLSIARQLMSSAQRSGNLKRRR
jgi:tetratricopeptide (TPR) repeat protein